MTFLSQEDHQRAIAGDHPERLGSCGREGFVSEILVVDPDGNPVPRDGSAAGEIIVRSEANMLGYWRRPDLTEKTLRDGWMWTGDIATWDAEGYVFIVDRAKDMIISGARTFTAHKLRRRSINIPPFWNPLYSASRTTPGARPSRRWWY